MKTIACYKVVPDNQDISARPDGGISFERAQMVLGDYDLMAIEEAVSIAEATDGSAALLTVGGANVKDTKLIKAALSRGASALYCVSGEKLAGADAYQTATAIASALRKVDYDLVVFGEGSADLYAQQVGLLVGAILGVPTVNSVGKVEPGEGVVRVSRTLESEVEVLDVVLPAVISVTADINLPRIPKMKDILAAGKKPVTAWDVEELDGLSWSSVEVVSVKAPDSVERKGIVYEGATDENVQELAANIKMAL